MEKRSSRARWGLAVGLGILAALAVGIWLAMSPTGPPGPPPSAAPGTSVSAMTTNPLDRARVGHRVPAQGRLTLEAGDTLGVTVKVQYHRPGTANMTLVDLGIPPGFAVMPEFFQALKDDGMIEKYTSNGRQITLYFRELSSEKPIEFAYELRAKFPVKAKTPQSVAYQYYEPEIRAVAAPVEIKVEKSRRLGYLR